MSRGKRPYRKVDEVRRLLAGPHPHVPSGLVPRAAEKGARLLRRHRAARRLGMCLLGVAVLVFAVWAGAEQPWIAPPAGTSPPLRGW
ncbi:hypothetical protein A6A29_01980 [Streptomyces sp. TSRI0281]|nr:hypothetical protein A6A29_01980 [Streptomyces sp. TSRI0281]